MAHRYISSDITMTSLSDANPNIHWKLTVVAEKKKKSGPFEPLLRV
jgi:hypothetical protein